MSRFIPVFFSDTSEIKDVEVRWEHDKMIMVGNKHPHPTAPHPVFLLDDYTVTDMGEQAAHRYVAAPMAAPIAAR